MLNFSFQNPTKIVFGEGEISKLESLIPQGKRVLLTYGGGSIKQNGVYEQVVKALNGSDFIEFGGIEANPGYETLIKAVALVKQENIDFLLAVGGGSVIDGTKFIAAAAKVDDDPWGILTGKVKVTDALPLGAVLTLPATGSESNGNSVVTRRETQEKLPFSSPLVYPAFAILDPTTTYSLPMRQVSNGIVDAFVHVMEQYLTYPVNAPVQDGFSETLLKTLISEGPKALQNPEAYDIRANIMWAATMALNGLIGQGVPQDWATHMIGHELTALHGMDHAQTLAVLLPSVMAYKKESKRQKLIQYAENVWGLAGSDDDKIDGAILKTRQFFESLSVPTRLSDYQVGAGHIDALVAQLQAHGMVKLGERQDITIDDSRQILEMSL